MTLILTEIGNGQEFILVINYKKIKIVFFQIFSIILFSTFLFPQENLEKEELQTENLSNISSTEKEDFDKEISADESIIEEKNEKQKKVTIPFSENPQVEKFRKIYLSPSWQSILRNVLENAMEYRLYVRKALQERNMPFYLEYLPIVESNYKTTAKSKSGAIGMWQFMANSVKPFLVLDDFIDERLDPWKSTEAALSKLTDNYNYFGDWLLAIAAYNCGAGAMQKAIIKSGSKDFWYLAENNYISKQTVQYIPKLFAIADIAENSDFYNVDLPSHETEFNLLYNEKNGIFDYLTVDKAYSLEQLALELRLEKSTIKHLNPSFIRGITHPAKKSQIRLPLGMEESAKSALKNLTPIEYPFKYKVVSGDSLWAISRKYNVSIQSICELNNINENDILKIGKILYIPSK